MITVDCGKDLHNSTDLVKIIEFIFKIGRLWARKLYLNVTSEKLNPSSNFKKNVKIKSNQIRFFVVIELTRITQRHKQQKAGFWGPHWSLSAFKGQ